MDTMALCNSFFKCHINNNLGIALRRKTSLMVKDRDYTALIMDNLNLLIFARWIGSQSQGNTEGIILINFNHKVNSFKCLGS